MGSRGGDGLGAEGAPRHAGRYVLGRVLGAGAMGVVRASFDPILEREVAVKVLGSRDIASLTDTDDSTRSGFLLTDGSHIAPTPGVDDARLLEEARSLARVAHPNIVEVFDVGVCEQGVFIAMELVDGVSLRAWNADNDPDWRAAVAMHVPAGEALAAAHAAGLVHGDFKPDNVLVTADLRVRVVDFGLARAIGHMDTLQRGVVFGTPAYLAPECWDEPRRDAAADQFAFFVALCEAIVGRRPYPRVQSLEALMLAIHEGPDLQPVGRLVPARLRRAIERGLALDPEQRFATMSEALAELRAIVADDRRARGRRLVAATALGLMVPFAAIGAGAHLHDRTVEHEGLAACVHEARAAAGTWHEDVRARVHSTMVAAEPRLGEDTSARVIGWLDAYAADLTATSQRACTVALGGPVELGLAQRQCLADRRDAMSTLIETLERADAGTVRNAVAAATELPRVDACEDPAWLARHRTSGPEGGLAPSTAAHTLARARELVARGRYDDAVPELESAYFEAREVDDDASAAIAVELAAVLAEELADLDGALAWVRHAETALAAIEAPDGETRAKIDLVSAKVSVRRGDFQSALAPTERARDILRATFGDEHPAVAEAELDLGNALGQLQRTDEAVACFERARVILERGLGPEHIDVAAAYHGLGMSNAQLGRFADARTFEERALAIRRLWLDEDHPDIATALAGVAYADLGLRRFDDARQGLQRVLAIRERTYGAEHPAVAATLGALAQVASKRGDCRDAIALLARALEMTERVAAGDHRVRVRFSLGLADAQLRCEDREAARRSYAAALALAEATPRGFEVELERARVGIEATTITGG